jgi:hypothetical protein
MMAGLNGVNAFFLSGPAASANRIPMAARIDLQPLPHHTDAKGMTDPEQPQPRRRPGLALFSLALAFLLINGGNTLKHATSTDDLLAVFGLTRAEGASVPGSKNQVSPQSESGDTDLIPQQIAPAHYAVGDTISLLGGVFVIVGICLLRRKSEPVTA